MKRKRMFFFAPFLLLLPAGICLADQPSGAAAGLSVLEDFFKRAKVGDPVEIGDLRVFPIFRAEKSDGDGKSFMVTDEAMKEKIIEVKEHNGGEVNTLKMGKEKSKRPVFMMGGEILSGAKQDRILSQDVLLPEKEGSYLLEVYCVEAGRWVTKSKSFETKGVMGTAKLRQKVAKKEGQSEVWGEVSKKSGDMEVSSPTQAMTANYDDPKVKQKIKKIRKELDARIGELEAAEDLIGVVAAVKGEIISLDAFRNEELMAAFWPKLSKSVALDAVDPSFKDGKVSKDDVALFIKSLGGAKVKPIKNPGIGKEISVESEWASGTAHLSENGVNHVNLFPEYGKYKMRIYSDGTAGSTGPSAAAQDAGTVKSADEKAGEQSGGKKGKKQKGAPKKKLESHAEKAVKTGQLEDKNGKKKSK
jgi:hypothetical protein